MPKIPLYEQGRLASSLVGTPGVDNSGQVMAESVASGLSQLNTALAYKQRQTLAAQKELETLTRNGLAGERVSAISLKKTTIANELKTKHMYDPDVGEVELNKQLDKLLEDEVAGIQDPMLKAMVMAKGRDEIVAEKKAYSDFKFSRAIPIAEKSYEAQAGDFAHQIAGLYAGPGAQIDEARVAQLGDEFDQRTAGISSMLYGPAAAEKNRKTKGDALAGLMTTIAAKGTTGDPAEDEKVVAQLSALAESGYAKAYLSPEDLKKTLGEAHQIARENSRIKHEQNIMRQKDTDLEVHTEATSAQLSGASSDVYKRIEDDARARGASPAAIRALQSLRVGAYKKATGELKTEDKAKQAAITKTVVVEAVSSADKFFNRFKTTKGAKPVNPYGPNEGVKSLRDYTDAVTQVTQAQARHIELTGAPNPTLQAKLDKLNAVGRKVQTSGNLRKQVVQYNSYKAAMPTPRFTGTASEVAAKKNQYNRLRDQAFIDHADAGQLDALNNPKKRAAVNVYILKQMGVK